MPVVTYGFSFPPPVRNVSGQCYRELLRMRLQMTRSFDIVKYHLYPEHEMYRSFGVRHRIFWSILNTASAPYSENDQRVLREMWSLFIQADELVQASIRTFQRTF